MKGETWSEHNPVEVSSEEALEKAARLAPPEEHQGKPAQQKLGGEGILNVDTGSLQLPSEFGEGKEKSRLLSIEPIAIVIIIFCLAFIAFIAYLISIEPPQAKDEAVSAVEQKP